MNQFREWSALLILAVGAFILGAALNGLWIVLIVIAAQLWRKKMRDQDKDKPAWEKNPRRTSLLLAETVLILSALLARTSWHWHSIFRLFRN